MSLENLIFRCLEKFWSARYGEKYGLVTSYDPEKHAAKVKIQPGGQETGWLPIHAHHVGDGWGILVGPQVDDQVKISHQEGDFEAGEITNRVHSDKDKPPKVESGEILFKHKDGGQIFFDKNQNITWTGANGQVIKTDKKGNVSVSLDIADDKKSDAHSPTFSVAVDNGKHKITVNKKDGITHESSVKVKVKAPSIEHEGDLVHQGNMHVKGSIFADDNISTPTGFTGPWEGSVSINPNP